MGRFSHEMGKYFYHTRTDRSFHDYANYYSHTNHDDDALIIENGQRRFVSLDTCEVKSMAIQAARLKSLYKELIAVKSAYDATLQT